MMKMITQLNYIVINNAVILSSKKTKHERMKKYDMEE